MSRLFPGIRRRMLWLPFALAVLGVAWQVAAVLREPRTYVASGLMQVGPSAVGSPSAALLESRPRKASFLLALFQSHKLLDQVLSRTKRLHPELTQVKVTMRADSLHDDRLVSVTATGEEPMFTRAYLDAFMEEATLFGDDLLPDPTPKANEQLFEKGEQLRDDERELAAFLKQHHPEAMAVEETLLTKRTFQLRQQAQALGAVSDQDKELTQIRGEHSEAEAKLSILHARLLALEDLRQKVMDDRSDYETWVQIRNEGEASSFSKGPFWAIFERPGPAVADTPFWSRRCLKSALVGFSLGLVLLFAASVLAATVGERKGEIPDSVT